MKKGRGEKEKSDLIESLSRITRSRKLKPTIQVSCEPKLDKSQDRLSPKIQLWGWVHNWRCMWESPAKPWFGRDLSGGNNV